LHAAVGIGAARGDEAVGVLAQRALAGLVAQRGADQRALDAVLVHLLERVADVVLVPAGLRHVLEHVLDGELEGLEALLVAEQRAHEVVAALRLGARNPHHEVDDPDVAGHGHGGLLGAEARAYQPRGTRVRRDAALGSDGAPAARGWRARMPPRPELRAPA